MDATPNLFRNLLPFFILSVSVVFGDDYGRPATAEEKKAVTANARMQEEAFNKKDSKTFSTLLKEDASYLLIDNGQFVEGRKAIIDAMENLYKTYKNPKISMKVDSVTISEPGKAIEIGTISLEDEGVVVVEAIYKENLVLENGKWLIQTIRELQNPSPPSHYNQLKDLAWLVGDWSDSDEDMDVETKTSFDENKNFLIQKINIAIFDIHIMDVEQLIGWDPNNKQVRSWIFDSDGGFGEGIWSQSNKEGKESWTVSATFTLPDGKKGSATNIYTKIDDNSFEWSSINRKVNNEPLPDIKPLKIFRKGKGGQNE